LHVDVEKLTRYLATVTTETWQHKEEVHSPRFVSS
jgi:hypothetical protein